MKLWLLEVVDKQRLARDDPWNGVWDVNIGLVVRAETEERAREIAQKNGADEVTFRPRSGIRVWQDPEYTSCVELLAEGEEGLILLSGENG